MIGKGIGSPSNWPARVVNLRDEQVAHRSTWAAVPDNLVGDAALHVVHVVPQGFSTVTYVNPVDPGTYGDPVARMSPSAPGEVFRRWSR